MISNAVFWLVGAFVVSGGGLLFWYFVFASTLEDRLFSDLLYLSVVGLLAAATGLTVGFSVLVFS